LEARGDEGRLRRSLQDGTRLTLLVTWTLSLGVAMLGAPGLKDWLGTKFVVVAGAVAVAMLGVAVGAVAQVSSNICFGIGRAGLILRASVIGVVVDLSMSVALVFPLGISGVFWGTICGNLVTVPLILAPTARHLGLEPRRVFTRSTGPVLPALVLEAIGCGIGLALGPTALSRLLIGVVLGGAGAAFGILRWGLHAGELRRFWEALSSRPASGGTGTVGR